MKTCPCDCTHATCDRMHAEDVPAPEKCSYHADVWLVDGECPTCLGAAEGETVRGECDPADVVDEYTPSAEDLAEMSEAFAAMPALHFPAPVASPADRKLYRELVGSLLLAGVPAEQVVAEHGWIVRQVLSA